jgi:hypothetical protein
MDELRDPPRVVPAAIIYYLRLVVRRTHLGTELGG